MSEGYSRFTYALGIQGWKAELLNYPISRSVASESLKIMKATSTLSSNSPPLSFFPRIYMKQWNFVRIVYMELAIVLFISEGRRRLMKSRNHKCWSEHRYLIDLLLWDFFGIVNILSLKGIYPISASNLCQADIATRIWPASVFAFLKMTHSKSSPICIWEHLERRS